jgi:type VI secretion system secreted protein Hcp
MAADNFLWFPTEATGGLLVGKAKKPEGETTDEHFKQFKALELKTFKFGVEQAETTGSGSGGAGAGKAKFGEFSVTKGVDNASAPLFTACCAGAHYPTVFLAMRKAGGSNLVYLQYCFRQVFCTKIDWSGGAGEEAPEEEVTFKYGAMGIQYIRQKPDGTGDTPIEGMWSVVTNKPTMTVDGLSGSAAFVELNK